jgi:hypothetical protein
MGVIAHAAHAPGGATWPAPVRIAPAGKVRVAIAVGSDWHVRFADDPIRPGKFTSEALKLRFSSE